MNWEKNESGQVTYLTFPALEREGVCHGFSTRLGGVSTGDCASMNLSFGRGDDPAAVMENHRRFARAVGYLPEHLVFTDQVHGTAVRRVDKRDCGKGIFRSSDIVGADGIITDDRDVVLMTFFADCVPLYFYDKKRKAIGASHSGWRGTAARMGAVTIEAMRREFGTEPEDVVSVIGPSICRNCYEVGGDVAGEFRRGFRESQWPEILEEKGEGKYQLDLWRANEIILQEAGIPAEQIEVSGLCTCCHPDLLFSHRASHGRRGSLAGIITLAENMRDRTI